MGASSTAHWHFGHHGACPEYHFENTTLVIARVVSRQSPDQLRFDLRREAVASEMTHPHVRLFGREDAVATTHSEEHLVLPTARAGQGQVGELCTASHAASASPWSCKARFATRKMARAPSADRSRCAHAGPQPEEARAATRDDAS